MKLIAFVMTRGNFAKLKTSILELRSRGHTVDVVIGGTLKSKLGALLEEIRTDIGISHELEVPKSSDEDIHAYISASTLLSSFKLLNNGSYDFAVIVGDRYELLPIATACLLAKTRIVHLEGGERSGSIDESIRHSVSKLAHLHFVATLSAKNLLVSLGEPEDRIVISGSPNFDLIESIIREDTTKLLQVIDIRGKLHYLQRKTFVVCIYHPTLLDTRSLEEQIIYLTKAVRAQTDAMLVLLNPNLDADALSFTDLTRHNCSDDFIILSSLTQEEYARLLLFSIFAIGNSSSLVRECPFLGVPSVVVGDRQLRRESAPSTIFVDYDEKNITEAVAVILHNSNNHNRYFTYGDGHAAKKICNGIELNSNIPFQK